MDNKINYNTSAITGSYDMIMGAVSSFSMVFLLANDMNEVMVGNMVALANLIATLTQPVLANMADRSKKFSLYHYIAVTLLLVVTSLVAILFFKENVIILFALYTMALALLAVLMPFHNSLIMFLIDKGYNVNFGVSRAMGSFMFAVTSTGVGLLVSRWGTDAIIYVGLLGAFIYFLANTLVNKKYLVNDEKQRWVVNTNVDQAPLDHIETPFFKKYPTFPWVLFGALNLFISHNIINTFMFQIVDNLGGGSTEMGFAFSLAALVEVPTMVFYTRITKKITHETALKFSSMFFVIKALITLLASSIYVFYLAQLTQALAFAIYIVACVYYTNTLMEGNDKTKGQAFLAAFQTTGAIIGGVVGGWIIGQFSIKYALALSLISTILGVICFQKGLSSKKV